MDKPNASTFLHWFKKSPWAGAGKDAGELAEAAWNAGRKDGLMTAQGIATDVIQREAIKYAVIREPIPGPPKEMALSGLTFFVTAAITSEADKL